MIEVQNLTRRYGDFTAVDSISFSVDDGEIVGMLGPNGAGKTTAIRMITGFLPPTAGRVRVAGRNLFEDPVEARRNVGYLPENVALYPEMRVSEYLAYRARLEGMTGGAAKGAIDGVLADCLLGDVSRQVIGTLSKGYRQRVGLAAAILHQPEVLVLDEPTVGLDPKQIIAIRRADSRPRRASARCSCRPTFSPRSSCCAIASSSSTSGRDDRRRHTRQPAPELAGRGGREARDQGGARRRGRQRWRQWPAWPPSRARGEREFELRCRSGQRSREKSSSGWPSSATGRCSS